jgi:hypothetical protein
MRQKPPMWYHPSMTHSIKERIGSMRISREFSNPQVVRQLETVDEKRLAAILDELDSDSELAAAIEYSRKQDAVEPPISARAYLASIENKA